MSRKVLFLVADEKTNKGDSDYMIAMAQHLHDASPDDIPLFYKVGTPGDGEISGAAADAADTNAGIGAGTGAGTDAAHPIPFDEPAYAAIPRYHRAVVEALGREGQPLSVIGVGASTLPATLEAAAILKRADIAWVTHMVEPADAPALERLKIQVFAPIKDAGVVATGQNPAFINLRPIEAVPHTNYHEACMKHYGRFMDDSKHAPMHEAIRNGERFAVAVLNAGFEVTDKDGKKYWHPYLEEEARSHGFALGAHMPAHTHLLLCDGGPRNLRDESMGNHNMQAFAQAYARGQKEQGGDPHVAAARFEPGQYNSIKAGYILAGLPQCIGFVCSSESYPTMDGAGLHVDNMRKLLGMFSFAAQEADASGERLRNIEKYNRMGVALLDENQGRLIIKRHPQQQATPMQDRDVGRAILSDLGLLGPATPALAPAPKAVFP